ASLPLPALLHQIPPPLASTLFPYTTLFRSLRGPAPLGNARDEFAGRGAVGSVRIARRRAERGLQIFRGHRPLFAHLVLELSVGRSEEHTSELQSRENLVCRLLLEKKKKC